MYLCVNDVGFAQLSCFFSITGSLGGVIGEEYADPYGQGRIVIK